MFPCEKCGICCRQVGRVPLGKKMSLPNGTCKYLDLKTNLCRIYYNRPIFCNVDAFYDKYFSNKMDREDFYKINKEECNNLKKEYSDDC